MTKILFGVVIPALVFIFSYVMTHLLYRHFAKQADEDKTPAGTTGDPSGKD